MLFRRDDGEKRQKGKFCSFCFLGSHTSPCSNWQMKHRWRRGSGAETVNRKSIKKASWWNSFCQSVAVSICYNFSLWIKHKLLFTACVIFWHRRNKKNSKPCRTKQPQPWHLQKLTFIFYLLLYTVSSCVQWRSLVAIQPITIKNPRVYNIKKVRQLRSVAVL